MNEHEMQQSQRKLTMVFAALMAAFALPLIFFLVIQ